MGDTFLIASQGNNILPYGLHISLFNLKSWSRKEYYIFTAIDIVFDMQGTTERVKDDASPSNAR